MLSLSVLSTAREIVGAAFLVAPALTSKLFLINASASAILPTRMAGTRDIVVGALTFYTARQLRQALKNREHHDTKHTNTAATASTPLNNNNNNNNVANAVTYSQLNMRYVLLANIAVDALDVMSCAWCFGAGDMSLDSALMLGIGASGLMGLGLYSLRKLPAINMK